jgi:hypothetical protein
MDKQVRRFIKQTNKQKQIVWYEQKNAIINVQLNKQTTKMLRAPALCYLFPDYNKP